MSAGAPEPQETAPDPEKEKGAEGKPSEPILDVAAGDRVRITAEAMIDPDAQEATPIRLFRFGWPNDFLVLEVFDDPKFGQVLVLDPCCNWIRDPKKRTVHVCAAHSARFFEVVEKGSQPGQGRRYSGVNIAGFDLVSVEYANGKDSPALAVRVAGRKPVVLRGQPAQLLAQLLQAQKIF